MIPFDATLSGLALFAWRSQGRHSCVAPTLGWVDATPLALKTRVAPSWNFRSDDSVGGVDECGRKGGAKERARSTSACRAGGFVESWRPSFTTMFWTEEIAARVADAGPQIVNDSKTPSGRVHVGALRGVLIHDAIFARCGRKGSRRAIFSASMTSIRWMKSRRARTSISANTSAARSAIRPRRRVPPLNFQPSIVPTTPRTSRKASNLNRSPPTWPSIHA